MQCGQKTPPIEKSRVKKHLIYNLGWTQGKERFWNEYFDFHWTIFIFLVKKLYSWRCLCVWKVFYQWNTLYLYLKLYLKNMCIALCISKDASRFWTSAGIYPKWTFLCIAKMDSRRALPSHAHRCQLLRYCWDNLTAPFGEKKKGKAALQTWNQSGYLHNILLTAPNCLSTA